MANIRRNNRHNLRLRVNEDEYWDFCINKDSFGEYDFSGNSLNKECLASYIDMGSSDSVDGDMLYGLPEYSWEEFSIPSVMMVTRTPSPTSTLRSSSDMAFPIAS